MVLKGGCSSNPGGSTGCPRGRGLSHLPHDAQAVVQRMTGLGGGGGGGGDGGKSMEL